MSIENLQVMRDGQPDPDFMPPEPTALEAAVSHVGASVSRVLGGIALEARMALYDARFGTNYREIRHTLIQEKRNREFEKEIGIIAVHDK